MRRCFEARQAFLEQRALRVRKDPNADEDEADALTPPRAGAPDGSSGARAIVIGTPSPASAVKMPRLAPCEQVPVPIEDARSSSGMVPVMVTEDITVPTGADILKCREPWYSLILDGVKAWDIKPYTVSKMPGKTGASPCHASGGWRAPVGSGPQREIHPFNTNDCLFRCSVHVQFF